MPMPEENIETFYVKCNELFSLQCTWVSGGIYRRPAVSGNFLSKKLSCAQ